MYRTLRLRLLEGDTGGNAGGATPQAGGASNTSPQAGSTTSSEPQAGDEPISLDEARKLRKENQTLRQRQKQIDDAKAAEEAARQTELERAQTTLAEREKQIQLYKDQLVQERVKSAAMSKGIIDPELAALALKDKLEFDDEGMPTNLDKALDDLLKAKPYLAQAQQQRQASSGGATNPGRQQAASGGAMTPEFARDVLSGKIPYHTLSESQKQQLIQMSRTLH